MVLETYEPVNIFYQVFFFNALMGSKSEWVESEWDYAFLGKTVGNWQLDCSQIDYIRISFLHIEVRDTKKVWEPLYLSID